jgi:hypothetical protein
MARNRKKAKAQVAQADTKKETVMTKPHPFDTYGEPEVEPLDADEVQHEFVAAGLNWICTARDGGTVGLQLFDDPPYVVKFKNLSQADRDKLQAGIDATIAKLRQKMGRRTAVFCGDVPPTWDDLSWAHISW